MNIKNKGFTMIEMLGVVVILVLISVFAFPAIKTLSGQSGQKKYDNFLNVLNTAASTYVERNFDKYNNTTIQYIYVKNLIENGYISDTLINPNTKEQVLDEDGIIIVTKNSDKTISYEYSLNEHIVIHKIEDLVELSRNVDNGNNYLNKIVVVASNLDFNSADSYKNPLSTSYGDINGDGNTNTLMVELTTIKGFNPIGSASNPFKGSFVGDGSTISNLLINRVSETEVGLFSVVDGGNINGITIKGLINGGNNTGLLAGKVINNTNIIDIKIEMKSDTSANTVSNIGGVIGYASNVVISNIESNYQIDGSANNVGGVIGNIITSNIGNIVTNGSINMTGSNIGGMFGIGTSVSINNITTKGRIIGGNNVGGIGGNISTSTNILKNNNSASITSSSKAGGLYGVVSNSTIRNSLNVGNIHSTNYAGGLVGELNGSTIELSYSNGLLSGTNYIGGLIGTMSSSNLNNTYNLGDIKGTSKIGGLVGNSVSSNINRSYMAGNITASSEAGGLIGVATNTTNLNYSYYNADKTLQSDLIGTNTSSVINYSDGLIDSEMRNRVSYNNWNFTTIWEIINNNYPTFRVTNGI